MAIKKNLKWERYDVGGDDHKIFSRIFTDHTLFHRVFFPIGPVDGKFKGSFILKFFSVHKKDIDVVRVSCTIKGFISVSDSDKARASAEADLVALEAGEIQNKDYMIILSFYSVKENKDQLVGFTDKVQAMSELTTNLNSGYRNRIKESRPKPTKEPKLVAGADAPPKVPAVPVAAKPSVPAIPTVGKTSTDQPTKSRK